MAASETATNTAETNPEDLSPLSEDRSRSTQELQCGAETGRAKMSNKRQARWNPLFEMRMPEELNSDGRRYPQASSQRPASAGASTAERARPSRIALERAMNTSPMNKYSALPPYTQPDVQGSAGLTRVLNHEDLLRTPKDTLITFGLGRVDFAAAYVVKFDLFAVYADFILTAPCKQWFFANSSDPVGPGQLQREMAPLLVTLLPLREIMEWIEHEELLSFYLVQAADWIPREGLIKEEHHDPRFRRQRDRTRVQRCRSFKSCEEASAAVFLDGYLQGISSIFGCIVIDSAKTDSCTYTSIKRQCMQQMHDFQDIVVKEGRDKLFIY